MALDLSTYSDADLEALRAQVRAEQETRARARMERAKADALVDALAAGKASDPIRVTRPDGSTYTITLEPTAGPAEWVSGTAYAADAEITYDGRRYRALKATAGTVPPPDADSVWQAL